MIMVYTMLMIDDVLLQYTQHSTLTVLKISPVILHTAIAAQSLSPGWRGDINVAKKTKMNIVVTRVMTEQKAEPRFKAPPNAAL